MKKFFLSLTLLAGVAGSAHAQRNVSLGLKAGGSLTDFSGAQASGYKSIFGFQAGAFANIGFTRLFAFQPEILYSQKGAKIASSPEITTRLNYVDVPLLFHLNVDGLFFEAGPQVGFLVAASSKVDNTSVDVKPAYNSVDAGYVFGLGYQRKRGLGLGLRYNGGITRVVKSYTAGSTTVQNNIRNNAFQLYLTYSLQGQ